ncbi:MAG: PDDEXK nuclease domain-containing protein [Acholeplasmatales bacterium]|nr:PDDEXK nuclease domain-containing protein [Acholeplasmatales bacterium]
MKNEQNNELFYQDYVKDLNEIKETIRNNRNKAMIVVNSAIIMTYYKIGTIINQRKKWGNKYIERLSNDLKEYGKGFSIQNLKFMSQFSKKFEKNKIGLQVASQIPWFTIIRIISKSKSDEEMLWYITQTHKNGWSRSTVLKQIEMKAYERSLIEPQTTNIVKSDDISKEIFKDTYLLGFADENSFTNEDELKKLMVNNIIQFLKELGPGFSLVDKEYKLTTPTNKDYYIDLLMYHTKIHAYVVIEVKIGEFEPRDLGQLIFYVNAIDKLERTEGDNETIGLLLCKDADKFVAETTLEKSLLKLGISKYKLLEELPEYLKKKLNEK